MAESETQAPTKTDIEGLLAFSPKFKEAAEPVSEWRDDNASFPHPIYDEWIGEFAHLAGRSCWEDYDYVDSGGREMIEDDLLINEASLDQIKTMLTYFVRGERFVDGLRGDLIRRGRLLAVAERLRRILETEY